MGTGRNITPRELLTLARSAASKLRPTFPTATKRLNLCKQLLHGKPGLSPLLDEFSIALSSMMTDSEHYWIGTFYSLLLDPADRRRQAVYFTPPYLANAIINLVVKEGYDLKSHSVIDPAAGGAAFLSTIASRMSKAGIPKPKIQKLLHGIEIDSGLARLSESLISKRLKAKVKKGSIVSVGDSLRKRNHRTYDLVVANPPYGRILQAELSEEKWSNVCYSGHINKYALFAELACKLANEGGLVALVLPSSFVAGPLYDRLRAHLRSVGQILVIGSVASRDDVFADVSQDVSVLILKKGKKHDVQTPVVFGQFRALGDFKPKSALKLPHLTRAPWPVPIRAKGLSVGGATLASYGAVARSGYFVWNREGERMHKRRHSDDYVPLVWAKNIRAGSFCTPASKDGRSIDYVKFQKGATAVIRTNAIVMQRTTNNAQKRRLIAARMSPSTLKKWSGFTTENHTLVITAPSVDILNDLCHLLNSKAVDIRYRQVSGTASVSVTLLKSLDLPDPTVLRKYLSEMADPEKAVEAAYAKSLSVNSKATA